MNAPSTIPIARQRHLGLLARAPAAALAARVAALGALPAFTWLRRPETGMVMMRGRIGGNGAQFNLGEVTVTRCTLRLFDGAVGVGVVRGTDARHAERVALCDALLQTAAFATRIQDEVVDALAREEAHRHARRAAEVAASKVDFFTLARGED